MSKEPHCLAILEGKSSRIIVDDNICEKIKTHKKSPLFILGFAGVGLIGTLVANELITQLKMKQIGKVFSEDLPPITVFYNGLLKHPFRIYYEEDLNLIVSICEVPFNPGSYTDLARTLIDWTLHHGINDIVCLQGMADERIFARNELPQVYAAAGAEILKNILIHGVKIPPRGLIFGAEAAILNECLNNNLTGIVYLTSANPQLPAPEGAAAILKKISEIYGFPVELDNLLKQGNEIKKALSDLQQKTNIVHSQPPLLPKKELYS